MIRCVISGGQTGADMAGLRAAKEVGILTGGWAPRGYLTEDGPKPRLLRSFGLQEHKSDKYPPRTIANIRSSDFTIIMADRLDSGSGLTRDMCVKFYKPWYHITPRQFDRDNELVRLYNWIEELHWGMVILPDRVVKLNMNVAGNRESKSPGIERRATTFLIRLFDYMKETRR